jgi:hypothetical protein
LDNQVPKIVTEETNVMDADENSKSNQPSNDIEMEEDGKPFSSTKSPQKEIDKFDTNLSKSFFVSSFPENFPLNWNQSSANNYVKPNTGDMDAVDASLFSENERQLALCLKLFSREFFIATGQYKLQVSEEYQELIRVMVWHNRSRIKQGLTTFSPEELELFLNKEMSQDFADLDIAIDDFLADLIKIRHSEQKSFDVYNELVKNNKKKVLSPTKNIIESTERQSAAQSSITDIKVSSLLTDTTSTNSDNTSTAPTKNLLKKFLDVADNPQNKSITDRPVILKNQEQ